MDYENKRVVVRADPGELDGPALVAALEEAGFGSKVLDEGTAARGQ